MRIEEMMGKEHKGRRRALKVCVSRSFASRGKLVRVTEIG